MSVIQMGRKEPEAPLKCMLLMYKGVAMKIGDIPPNDADREFAGGVAAAHRKHVAEGSPKSQGGH